MRKIEVSAGGARGVKLIRRLYAGDRDLFRLGAAVWLAATFLGYYFYRLGGSGLYKEGYSLPAMLPMGVDFRAVHAYGAALRESVAAYMAASSSYPPFVTVALLPFTFLPADAAYRLYVLVLLAALCGMVWASLAGNAGEEREGLFLRCLGVALLLFFSYPVNFGLERGNSDLVAGALAAASLYFMSRGRFWPSVLSLAAATQFKLYPAVLLSLLFIRFGWRAAAWFAAVNAAAFLMLGPGPFLQFKASLSVLAGVPSTWEGNHSVYAYLDWLARKGRLGQQALPLYRNACYAALAALFSAAWLRTWLASRRRATGEARPLSGAETGLAGACFCLMSLIPSVSYDYKLGIQAAPLLLLLSSSPGRLLSSVSAARWTAALASALTAFALLPRNLMIRMKTPWLLMLFALYLYLALRGESGEAEAAK